MTTIDISMPDYVLVGHITRDLTPHGPQLGGPVSFGAYTAAAFGLRVGILTSTAPDEPLLHDLPPQVSVISVPAAQTTTFENCYSDKGRTQWLYHRARTLTPEMLPAAWRKAPQVQLAVVAYEVTPAFVTAFEAAHLCITPQGWMRQREPDGRVRKVHWDAAEDVLPHGALTVLSEEDIQHAPDLVTEFAALTPLLVLTQAARGGKVFQGTQRSRFEAYPAAAQVDSTGAGDIFATALHIALYRLGDLRRALRVATYVAGVSVTRSGFASAPTADEVAAAWRFAADDI
ncbi:MAG: hypothetical protein K8S97_04335 [Anaerolineae bacterium]|nr:hypothetical protein [Anaerolineae bacterium]